MTDRKGAVTFQGNPLTLTGSEVKIGDNAPEFTLTANDMKRVSLADFKGNVLILAAVPSLDTSVCDRETRWFNQEATKLGGNVKVLTISMDLPFAQARWCGAAGVKNVQTLSDYNGNSFGTNYGILIKELHLLARTVFVIDKNGKIQYMELVKEMTNEPNYEAVLKAVKELI